MQLQPLDLVQRPSWQRIFSSASAIAGCHVRVIVHPGPSSSVAHGLAPPHGMTVHDSITSERRSADMLGPEVCS
jgi:hypothetical protein